MDGLGELVREGRERGVVPGTGPAWLVSSSKPLPDALPGSLEQQIIEESKGESLQFR